MKKTFKILLMILAYLACFLMGGASGLIHPVCYAYGGAVLPLLTAFVYLYTCTVIRKGVRWSFVPFAFTFFAYTGHWWTDTEGSLAAAVEEMPAGYDQLMKPVIDNVPVLILVLVLTIPIAIFAMRLAETVLKKPAASLK